MRMSISTQSCASTPPWPTEIVTTALWLAYGAVKSRSSSRERNSAAIVASSSATCLVSSGSPEASWSSSIRSRARFSICSQVLVSSRFSAPSRASALARRGSSQTPGWVRRWSSSSARLSFAGRSKVLLQLHDALEQLFGTQLNVHLPSVAPLVFLARPAPAGIVAAQLSGRRPALGCRRAYGDRPSLLGSAVAACLGRAIRIARSGFQQISDERLGWRGWSIALHVDAKDPRHDRALDSLSQLVEHFQGLVLVLDQRVALAVRAQPDAFAEVLHLRQVLHPLPVDGPQHHVLLDQRHELDADLLDLLVVGIRGRRVQVVGQSLGAARHHLFRYLRAGLDRQVRR